MLYLNNPNMNNLKQYPTSGGYVLVPPGTTLRFSAASSSRNGTYAAVFRDTATSELTLYLWESDSAFNFKSNRAPTKIPGVRQVSAPQPILMYDRRTSLTLYLLVRNGTNASTYEDKMMSLRTDATSIVEGQILLPSTPLSTPGQPAITLPVVLTPPTTASPTNASLWTVEAQAGMPPRISRYAVPMPLSPLPVPSPLLAVDVTPFTTGPATTIDWPDGAAFTAFATTATGDVVAFDTATLAVQARTSIAGSRSIRTGSASRLVAGAAFISSDMPPLTCFAAVITDANSPAPSAQLVTLTTPSLASGGASLSMASAMRNVSGGLQVVFHVATGVVVISTDRVTVAANGSLTFRTDWRLTDVGACTLSTPLTISPVFGPGIAPLSNPDPSVSWVASPFAVAQRSSGGIWLLRGVYNTSSFITTLIAFKLELPPPELSPVMTLAPSRGRALAVVGIDASDLTGSADAFFFIATAPGGGSFGGGVFILRLNAETWTFDSEVWLPMSPSTPFDGMYLATNDYTQTPWLVVVGGAGNQVYHVQPAPSLQIASAMNYTSATVRSAAGTAIAVSVSGARLIIGDRTSYPGFLSDRTVVTPIPSPSTSARASASGSASVTASQSRSASVSPSLAASSSVSGSGSATPSRSGSLTVSGSSSPSVSSSSTGSPSVQGSSSPSSSPSLSVGALPSSSVTSSPAVSSTPSLSPSITESASQSPSPSRSASATPSVAASVSPSLSPSMSPSVSVSPSQTGSVTGSAVAVFSPAATATPSAAASITASAASTVSATASTTFLAASVSQTPPPASLPPLGPSPTVPAAVGATLNCSDPGAWAQRLLVRVSARLRIPLAAGSGGDPGTGLSPSLPADRFGLDAINRTAPVVWLSRWRAVLAAVAAFADEILAAQAASTASASPNASPGAAFASPAPFPRLSALPFIFVGACNASTGFAAAAGSVSALPCTSVVNTSLLQRITGDLDPGIGAGPADAALQRSLTTLVANLTSCSIPAAAGSGSSGGSGGLLLSCVAPPAGQIDVQLQRASVPGGASAFAPTLVTGRPGSLAAPGAPAPPQAFCAGSGSGNSSGASGSCVSSGPYAPPHVLLALAPPVGPLSQLLRQPQPGTLLDDMDGSWTDPSRSVLLWPNSTVVALTGFVDAALTVGAVCSAAAAAGAGNPAVQRRRELQASPSAFSPPLTPALPLPPSLLQLLQAAAGACAQTQADMFGNTGAFLPSARSGNAMPVLSCSEVALLSADPRSFAGSAGAASFPAALLPPQQPATPSSGPTAPSTQPSPTPSPAPGKSSSMIPAIAGGAAAGLLLLIAMALGIAALTRFCRTFRSARRQMRADATSSLLRVAAAERAMVLAAAGATECSHAGMLDMLTAAFPAPQLLASAPAMAAVLAPAAAGTGIPSPEDFGAAARALRASGQKVAASFEPMPMQMQHLHMRGGMAAARDKVASAVFDAFAAARAAEDASAAAAAAASSSIADAAALTLQAAEASAAAVGSVPASVAAPKQRAMAALHSALPEGVMMAAFSASLDAACAALAGAGVSSKLLLQSQSPGTPRGSRGAPATADAAAAAGAGAKGSSSSSSSGGGAASEADLGTASCIDGMGGDGSLAGAAGSARPSFVRANMDAMGPRAVMKRVIASAAASVEAAMRNALGDAGVDAMTAAAGVECARFADLWEIEADAADAALPAAAAVPLADQMAVLAAAANGGSGDDSGSKRRNARTLPAASRDAASSAAPSAAAGTAGTAGTGNAPSSKSVAGRVASLRAAIEARLRDSAAARARTAAAAKLAATASGPGTPSSSARVRPDGSHDDDFDYDDHDDHDDDGDHGSDHHDDDDGDVSDHDGEAIVVEEGGEDALFEVVHALGASRASGSSTRSRSSARAAAQAQRLRARSSGSPAHRAAAVRRVRVSMADAKRVVDRSASASHAAKLAARTVSLGEGGPGARRGLTAADRARCCMETLVLVALGVTARSAAAALQANVDVADEAAARLATAAATAGVAAVRAHTDGGAASAADAAAAGVGLASGQARSIAAAAAAGVAAGDENAARAAQAAAGLLVTVAAIDRAINASASARARAAVLALLTCGRCAGAAGASGSASGAAARVRAQTAGGKLGLGKGRDGAVNPIGSQNGGGGGARASFSVTNNAAAASQAVAVAGIAGGGANAWALEIPAVSGKAIPSAMAGKGGSSSSSSSFTPGLTSNGSMRLTSHNGSFHLDKQRRGLTRVGSAIPQLQMPTHTNPLAQPSGGGSGGSGSGGRRASRVSLGGPTGSFASISSSMGMTASPLAAMKLAQEQQQQAGGGAGGLMYAQPLASPGYASGTVGPSMVLAALQKRRAEVAAARFVRSTEVAAAVGRALGRVTAIHGTDAKQASTVRSRHAADGDAGGDTDDDDEDAGLSFDMRSQSGRLRAGTATGRAQFGVSPVASIAVGGGGTGSGSHSAPISRKATRRGSSMVGGSGAGVELTAYGAQAMGAAGGGTVRTTSNPVTVRSGRLRTNTRSNVAALTASGALARHSGSDGTSASGGSRRASIARRQSISKAGPTGSGSGSGVAAAATGRRSSIGMLGGSAAGSFFGDLAGAAAAQASSGVPGRHSRASLVQPAATGGAGGAGSTGRQGRASGVSPASVEVARRLSFAMSSAARPSGVPIVASSY